MSTQVNMKQAEIDKLKKSLEDENLNSARFSNELRNLQEESEEKLSVAEEKLRESEKTKIELQNEIHNINEEYQILKDELKSENVKSTRYLEELQKWETENAELCKKLEYKPSSSSAHVQTEEECKDLIQIKEELVLMKSNLKETKIKNCGLSTQVNMKQAEIDKLKKSLEDECFKSSRFSNELRKLRNERMDTTIVATKQMPNHVQPKMSSVTIQTDQEATGKDQQ